MPDGRKMGELDERQIGARLAPVESQSYKELGRAGSCCQKGLFFCAALWRRRLPISRSWLRSAPATPCAAAMPPPRRRQSIARAHETARQRSQHNRWLTGLTGTKRCDTQHRSERRQ